MISEGCQRFGEIMSRGIPTGEEADFTVVHIADCSDHAVRFFDLFGIRPRMEEVFGIVEEVGREAGMAVNILEGDQAYGRRLDRMHGILDGIRKERK